jgi:hypothetical protein
MALFVAMQVFANHVQITYYTLLLTGIYFLARLVEVARHGAWTGWLKAAAVAAFAVALGFGSNLSKLWPTYEYSKETIRGKSGLTAKAAKGDGLDTDYLFGWSYGKAESLTLLVPHFAGGGAEGAGEAGHVACGAVDAMDDDDGGFGGVDGGGGCGASGLHCAAVPGDAGFTAATCWVGQTRGWARAGLHPRPTGWLGAR